MRRLVVVLLFLLCVPTAGAWTWPIQGPVLQPFAFDPAHPYAGGQHRGVDIGASAAGAPVLAPVAGTVSFAGSVPSSGITVTIETAGGLSITLTHLGSKAVAKDAAVAEGDVVGTIGPSGTAEVDGPYVHLGIRTSADPNGYFDPLAFLPVVAPPAAAAPPEPAAVSPPAAVTPPADATPPAAAAPPAEAVPPVAVAPAPAPTPQPVESAPPAEATPPATPPAEVPAPAPAAADPAPPAEQPQPEPVPSPTAPDPVAATADPAVTPLPLEAPDPALPAPASVVSTPQVAVAAEAVHLGELARFSGGAHAPAAAVPAATEPRAAGPVTAPVSSPAIPRRLLPSTRAAHPSTQRDRSPGSTPLVPLGIGLGAGALALAAAALARRRRPPVGAPEGAVVVRLRPPKEDGHDRLAA